MERKLHRLLVVALAASSLATLEAAENKAQVSGQERLEEEVRHELAMLPYYNVFDILGFKVEDHTVTLAGQVTRPALKNDAESAVRQIEGVENVVNDIEVLPPSPMDDRIRAAEYRSIYSAPGLQRYAMGATPSIHIVVDNGRVTLEGVVNSEADKNIAGMRAQSVPGTFGVTNNLKVEKG